jgi:gluconate 2-dehydrogenase gamma chain
MSEHINAKLGRRSFLQGVAAATGAVSLSSPPLPAAVGLAGIGAIIQPGGARAEAPSEGASTRNLLLPEAGYQSLGPEEAGFVEALVNIMCPADTLTPNGVDCGLAVYIDRQLAGGFGKGERLYSSGPWMPGKPQHGYQLPLTPEQFFKAGVASANEAALRKFGRGFTELQPDEADAFLHDVAGGKVVDARLPLGTWFNELVYPLFVQACFADPIYGGNVGKVFWKMIGYPGLPATHAEDMVQFRDKPYPGAQEPKAIADFS